MVDRSLFLLPMTCSVAKSYLTLWDPLGCSTPCFPVLHYILKYAQAHPLSQWHRPTISSSDVPFSFCPQSFPALGFFQWAGSSDQVVKVLELQLQHLSFQWIFRINFLWDWPVYSPCCPRDSQESAPASQFESINFLMLTFLYGPTLRFVHDYWKTKHKFDHMNHCWQSNVSDF